MSVTVGFSQATTSLIVPAPAATKPDGVAIDGADESGGLGLFAALLSMLAPGAQPPAEADAAATPSDAPVVVAAGSTILPAMDAFIDPVVAAPVPPELADLQKSKEGKALLEQFADALKAAQAALDGGEPLDPALEKKLVETVEAIAAWFAGQPQLQPIPIDAGKLSELASGSNILPVAPSGDLPDVPVPSDAAPDSSLVTPETIPAKAADTDTGTVVEKTMQLQTVPARLAELGDALKDFAAELEKTAPDLAKSIAGLADRISVGDISDDVFKQLGLTRSPGSTSPELDQLVAALTAKPQVKNTTATPASPIAAPVLEIPESLAVATTAPEAKRAELPQPQSTRPETKADVSATTDTPAKTEPLTRSTDAKLDADVKLEPLTGNSDSKANATDGKAAAPAAQASGKPDTPAPVAAATPVVTNADTAAQGAQAAQAAAATAAASTRAIHAAYAAPVQQLNVPQVAFEVARQFGAGNTRFQIRLDPADLGRIDVKLDLDKNGTVSAHMFVERPETLDLMMRDQRALQQALQQAGLDQSKTSLEFSLRQNPFAGTGADTGQGGGNGQPGFGPYGTPVADEGAELAAQTLYRGSASASGVNLFV